MADDDGKISGVERRYYLAALELKGHLYDTKPPSGCNHGALPASEFSREQNGLMITQYFAERAEDEDKGAPLGFTNMQFLYRKGEISVNPTTRAIILHDAANHTLRGDYGSARILARLHMNYDVWLKAGKPPVPWQSGELEKHFMGGKGKLPEWMLEVARLLNSIETPAEVTRYISQHLQCQCLSNGSKKAAKQAEETIISSSCHHCRKTGTPAQFSRCSKCKAAFYCGRECQVAAWPSHKASCRMLSGKSAKMQDVSNAADQFQKEYPPSK